MRRSASPAHAIRRDFTEHPIGVRSQEPAHSETGLIGQDYGSEASTTDALREDLVATQDYGAPGRPSPAVYRPASRPGRLGTRLRDAASARADPSRSASGLRHAGPLCSDQLPESGHYCRPGKAQMASALMEDAARAGIRSFGLDDPRQGILHVVGPEQGLSWPGSVIVCGDSHTSTHGALGALAFGIGATEVCQVLATQALWQRKPKTMRIAVDGVPCRRRFRQRRDPCNYRRDRRCWRYGPCHRVCRVDHCGAVDGGPADRLQHVDRSRSPGRHDRPRRHHLRLPRWAPVRAGGPRMGAAVGALARPCRPTPTPASTEKQS